MKKKLVFFTSALLVVICVMALAGCDLGSGGTQIPDFNADIQAVAPESIGTEHFVAEADTTYYTSPGLSMCIEINGAFMIMDYFSLDGDRRVYDNLYLYEGDYFYMVSDDMKYYYAALGDGTDPELAEVERQSGEDVQVNVKKTGIYKLTFDVKALKFDLEYKAEIEEPVYYTIKNCSIYSLATSWVEMSVDPANEDRFVINNFHVESGKIIGFYNNLHVSNYKVTLDAAAEGKLASARKTDVTVNIGGSYNIYINRKTYVVSLELVDPDNADYGCVYYDGTDFNVLAPSDAECPYIFRQRIEVTTKYTTRVPDFHSEHYRTYALTVVDPADVLMGSGDNYYFKEPGVYELTVNLKTFEVSVLPIAE